MNLSKPSQSAGEPLQTVCKVEESILQATACLLCEKLTSELLRQTP